MAVTHLQPKFTGTVGKVLKFNSSLQLQAVDPIIDSIPPQIVVYAETGSTVTCSQNGVNISGTSSNGKWTFNLPVLGMGIWTCTATKSGQTATTTVNVNQIKQYVRTLEYT